MYIHIPFISFYVILWSFDVFCKAGDALTYETVSSVFGLLSLFPSKFGRFGLHCLVSQSSRFAIRHFGLPSVTLKVLGGKVQ